MLSCWVKAGAACAGLGRCVHLWLPRVTRKHRGMTVCTSVVRTGYPSPLSPHACKTLTPAGVHLLVRHHTCGCPARDVVTQPPGERSACPACPGPANHRCLQWMPQHGCGTHAWKHSITKKARKRTRLSSLPACFVCRLSRHRTCPWTGSSTLCRRERRSSPACIKP